MSSTLPTLDSMINGQIPMNDNQMINMNGGGETLVDLNEQIEVKEDPKKEENEIDKNLPPILPQENEVKTEEVKTEKEEETKENDQKKDSAFSFFNLEKLLCIFNFIKPYFKVKYNDIKTRVISSFIPLNNNFIKIANDNPDLYGPFWIYTTLIYVMAAGGALSYYFTNSANNYFQMFVPVAGSIIYTFGFGFPFALWICMKLFKIDMKYVSLICLYGYSLTCLVPVLILCSTGFAWIQWLLLMYGICNSTAFVLINLWNIINELEKKNKYTLLGILAGGQFILFLILKFYFFGSSKVQNFSQPDSNLIPQK